MSPTHSQPDDGFDAYYKWLGIPADEQPANHYRLLGLRNFESDQELIANAADQRIRHVRTFQNGARSATSQQILNELTKAFITLSSNQRRAEYDAQLRATQPVPAPPAFDPSNRPAFRPTTVSMKARPVPVTADMLRAAAEENAAPLSVGAKSADAPRTLGRRMRENISTINSTLVSLIFHTALLLILALIHFTTAGLSNLVLFASSPEPDLGDWQQLSVEEIDYEMAVAGWEQSQYDVAQAGRSGSAEAQQADVDVSLTSVDSALAYRSGRFGFGDGESLLEPIGIGDAKGNSVIVEGPSLRDAETPEAAVNGLGGDIVRRLEEGNVQVVWMLDASLSMWSDRLRASRQMAVILREIEDRLEGRAYQAKHALLAFGQRSIEVQSPTLGWSRVVRQAKKIPNDLSGKENVFTALQYAIPEYRKTTSDHLQFIIWTDESGDDISQLEQTIALCQRENVSVCIVGPVAVLGRRRGAQFFHVPQLHPYRGYLPVEKGPDSGVPQLVAVRHWHGQALPVFGGLLPNALPSGFGPYHLVRLTQATGGSYTAYDRLADRARYVTGNLRAYLPSYESAATVRAQAEKHPLRRAVIRAAEITAKTGNFRPPLFDPNDETEFFYWLPPAEYQAKFKEVVRRDLRNVKQAIPLIEQAYQILTDDALISALEKERSPRWKANYLLARGRLAAMSVRHREYELLAEAILAGRAFRPASNMASIHISSTLLSGEWGTARRDDALHYLGRCMSEHADTPWAELANWERRYSLGMSLSQRSVVASGTGPASPPGQISGPSI